MDFDNRKVYGDTSITDGLVSLYRLHPDCVLSRDATSFVHREYDGELDFKLCRFEIFQSLRQRTIPRGHFFPAPGNPALTTNQVTSLNLIWLHLASSC